MKEHIKYAPLGLFLALGLKLLINEITIESVFVLGIFSLYSAYLLKVSEKSYLDALASKIETLEQRISEKEKETEELRSHVSSIKLGHQVSRVAKF